MTPLPVLDCNDCGKCCMHVGTPPGFYVAFLSPLWDGAFLTDSDDYRRFVEMPPAAREELAAYYAARDQGAAVDRAAAELPCLWFDLETKRCRHYESRPQTCREAIEPGDEYCTAFHKKQ